MTLNELIVLILIYTSDLDELTHPDTTRKDWVNNAINCLHQNGLIQSIKGEFEPTARGFALIEHIKDLPLPVQTWRMP